jgi:CheY-specific phosphatase CheX
LLYIRKSGTTLAAAGTIRIERRRNIKKSVTLGLNREKAYDARKETSRAMVTELKVKIRLFVTAFEKVGLEKRSTIFAMVGPKINFGGRARISALLLKVDMAIQMMGAINTNTTAQRAI